MSYESSQSDEAAAQQRATDTAEYTRLENDIASLVAQAQAWHNDGQALATASTQNPGDTNDLNALRTQLIADLQAVLGVAFT